ncbi:hypothetical protein O7627_24305 [Solwaraspora sp. WMMD1047]|uniref:hypothetical protein n=1 Tax=Solwaraspora sp. WMMD1047 TaxID=3016102 RepID=UPI002416A22E|nr:hypothetical protein [Solwaraspora sp. WMMD1047]MDG4832406.1 hypothetical protein [Solwaraspora sp. WMMD1047]
MHDDDAPEPNCYRCCDSGRTRRGRRCPDCNPSWLRSHWVWATWTIRQRITRAHRTGQLGDESPF